MVTKTRLNVGIIGSGAAGLSAAWLLGRDHRVTLMEQESRLGGHAHTAWVDETSNCLLEDSFDAQELLTQKSTVVSEYSPVTAKLSSQQPPANSLHAALAIDTGFIVFNHQTYPNLLHWFEALGVATEATDMSFSVSRDGGNFEYAGGVRGGLLAQPANILKPRFWLMLKDLVRFYREAPKSDLSVATDTLGDFLKSGKYNQAFIDDHLLPFGAAIWSTSQANMLAYPVSAFVKFCDNHGLLKLSNRPRWRTVVGGSAMYVNAVRRELEGHSIVCNFEATRVQRTGEGVRVTNKSGELLEFDQVVFACHADQALALLDQPDAHEQELLGAFKYDLNTAVLHTDSHYLPKRKRAWASWNYVEQDGRNSDSPPGINYWMNKLQNLKSRRDYIVSLNPTELPAADYLLRQMQYWHPVFNSETLMAQQKLWRLQGNNRSWFCGSYFGAGFHEDAIQSGFAVAEQLGGVKRPWDVEGESSRITLEPSTLGA